MLAAPQGLYQVRSTPYTEEVCARGVFATEQIQQGTLVEIAHCIKFSAHEYQSHGRHTVLEHYLFKGTDGTMLLALGVGSLFNHAQKPSLDYRIDGNQSVIRYFAARNIMAEEELTIFYGDKLWFEDTSIMKEQISMTSGMSDSNMSHEHMDDEHTFLGHMTL